MASQGGGPSLLQRGASHLLESAQEVTPPRSWPVALLPKGCQTIDCLIAQTEKVGRKTVRGKRTEGVVLFEGSVTHEA